jgi:hypothetical protein
VARPVLAGDLAIVFRALVDILDQHRHRRAGGDHCLAVLIEDEAGQDLDLVGLATLRDKTRLAGAALVELGLDFGAGETDAGRAAIDDAAERWAMAFAPGGDAEKVAECVVRHERYPTGIGDKQRMIPKIGKRRIMRKIRAPASPRPGTALWSTSLAFPWGQTVIRRI